MVLIDRPNLRSI